MLRRSILALLVLACFSLPVIAATPAPQADLNVDATSMIEASAAGILGIQPHWLSDDVGSASARCVDPRCAIDFICFLGCENSGNFCACLPSCILFCA
ncbi:MAG: hypothetical protein AAGN66_24835 [Acidobacteriota bacterium]